MILKRRFPNFMDLGPEFWTEHQINSIEDIHNIEWMGDWLRNPIWYSDNNPYLNPTKYPYNLIGSIQDESYKTRYLVIGLFTEDPSQLGIAKFIKPNENS